jgi:hypothetical protein
MLSLKNVRDCEIFLRELPAEPDQPTKYPDSLSQIAPYVYLKGEVFRVVAGKNQLARLSIHFFE